MMYLNVAGDACLGVGNCNGGEYSKTAAAYALFYNQLPELKGLSTNPDGFERGGSDKSVYFLSNIWPDRLVKNLPLRAIIIPHITNTEDSSVEPCSQLEAIAALLPSTVGQLPAATADDCQRMVTLVRHLPAYRLNLGRDICQIPVAIQSVLER